jgi:hypothetical protein
LDELKKVPFYAWECLTLQLKDRDVHLVLRKQEDMDLLLKFLIHKLRTMDGKKGSAEALLNLMA